MDPNQNSSNINSAASFSYPSVGGVAPAVQPQGVPMVGANPAQQPFVPQPEQPQNAVAEPSVVEPTVNIVEMPVNLQTQETPKNEEMNPNVNIVSEQMPGMGSTVIKDLADKLSNLKAEFTKEAVSEGLNTEIPVAEPTITQMPIAQPVIADMPMMEASSPAPTPVEEVIADPIPTVQPESFSAPVENQPSAVNNATEAPSYNSEPLVPSSEVNAATDGSHQFTIQQLLDIVIERDASDLHITVGYPVMVRVDGALRNVSEQIVSVDMANELILPVLPEQKKELLEVNREVDLAYSHADAARFRINAYYQKQSLAAAFRLIPNKIKSIDELKLPQIYHQIAKLKQGLVLVTGPTGSGKSTTLASILHEINMTRPDHMITIEDPIEYVFPKAMAMVDQREMHEDTHSWEIALKSALRQDPDVLLVGEMRDFETIAAAITLAETGHLVFATLHTNSASQTVDRIIDVFPEHQQPQIRAQLSHVIEAVIAQRLIPLPSGGRMAVSEIMLANPAVKNLIREAKTHQLDNVIRTSADMGMISLEHSLVKLVRENVISMDLAQEYAVHPEEVVRLLKS